MKINFLVFWLCILILLATWTFVIAPAIIQYSDFLANHKCEDNFGKGYFADNPELFEDKFNCCKKYVLVNNGVYEKQKICHGIDLVEGR